MTEKRSDKTLWDFAIDERDAKKPDKGEGHVDHGPHGEESSVFILGSRSSGKTSIILRFLERDEAPKPTTGLDYTFGRRAKGPNLVKDVGHIWELGGGTSLSKLVEIPLKADTLRSMSVVIVVDLSKPTELWFTLETLLGKVRARVNGVLAEISKKDPSAGDAIKKAAWKKYDEKHEDKALLDPLPIPLAIIGSKYDVYQDFDSEKRKMITRALRFVAHTNGAHLQYFSNKADALMTRARSLMGALLFHTQASKSVMMDHNKPVIIQPGSDSLSQIGAPPVAADDLTKLKGRNPSELWKAAFAVFFPPEKSVQPEIPEDPAKDPQYAEPAVDSIRAQKDEELERYRKITERKARTAAAAGNTMGSGSRIVKAH